MNQKPIRDFTSDTPRPSILIIGLGNALRSDDGIGWRVVTDVRANLDAETIEVIECQELAPEMADKIRGAALVIFVDAAIEGIPGEVRHQRLNAPHARSAKQVFAHGRTPEALVALAAELYAATPEVHLFTVSGSSFRYGEEFSPEVAGALPFVVDEILELLLKAESGTLAGKS
jgi:hydrogenase maturation protease